MKPPLTADEDLNYIFDMAVAELQARFEYSEDSAIALTQEYYRLFRDPEFCRSIGVAVQDEEFFFHEAPGGMALRIHYYLGLKADPDPGKFIEWRTQYFNALRNARKRG